MSDQASLEMPGWLGSDWDSLFHLPGPNLPMGEWWQHGPLVQWLISQLRPQFPVGAGDLWGGVQGFLDRQERPLNPVSLTDPQASFDLLVLDAAAMQQDLSQARLDQLATTSAVILHGLNPGFKGRDFWQACSSRHGVRTLEFNSGAGLGLMMIGDPDRFPGPVLKLFDLSPEAHAAFARRCTLLARGWELSRQNRLDAVRIASLSRRVQHAIDDRQETERPPVAPVKSQSQQTRLSIIDRVMNRAKWRLGIRQKPAFDWEDFLVSALATRPDLFDAEEYLQRNPDVLAAGVDPYVHFVQHGASEGRYSGAFDIDWYLEAYPDAAASDLHPLLQYLGQSAQAHHPMPLSMPDNIGLPFWKTVAEQFENSDAIPDATLYRVATGTVARVVDPAKLQQQMTAIGHGLDRVDQMEPQLRLVVDDGAPSDIGGLISADIRCMALSGVPGFSAGHNRAMDAAFESGADYYVGLHSAVVVTDKTISAMILPLRAFGAETLVLDYLPGAENAGGNGQDAGCFALREKLLRQLGGLDVSLAPREALIDLILRAKAAGFRIVTAKGAGTTFASDRQDDQLGEVQSAGSSLALARKWRFPELAKQAASRLRDAGAMVPAAPNTASATKPPVRLPELEHFDRPQLLW